MMCNGLQLEIGKIHTGQGRSGIHYIVVIDMHAGLNEEFMYAM